MPPNTPADSRGPAAIDAPLDQTAHLILSHQPRQILLFDTDPALKNLIERLLLKKEQYNAGSGAGGKLSPPGNTAKIVRISPESAFTVCSAEEAGAAKSADVSGRTMSAEARQQCQPARSIVELLLEIPGLLTADVVYLADPIALVEAAIEAGSAIPDSADEKAGENSLSNIVSPPEPGKLALTVLALLRDRVRGAVYVACPPDQSSTMPVRNDFFALGYRQADFKGSNQAVGPLYFYSLREYKQVPGWLNSRYWANPERWDIND